jgi:hypothetical protein
VGRTNITLTPKPSFYNSKHGLFHILDCKSLPYDFQTILNPNGF